MKHPSFSVLAVVALLGVAGCAAEEGDSLDEGAAAPVEAGYETAAPGAAGVGAPDAGMGAGTGMGTDPALGTGPATTGAGSTGVTGTGTTTGTAGGIDTTLAGTGTGGATHP